MTTQAQDLDTKIAAAADVLEKLAAEEGIDLNMLSQEEVGGLLSDIMGAGEKVAAEEQEQEQEQTQEQGQYEGPSVAAVGLELAKIAAAENIDLSQLSAEEYEACFNKVAADLQDPSYGEKLAEAEKLAAASANMEELGRVAARGFYDELNKLAADENPFAKKDDKDDEEEDEKEEKKAALKDLAGKAKDLLTAGAGKARDAAGKAHGAGLSGLESIGNKLPGKGGPVGRGLGAKLVGKGDAFDAAMAGRDAGAIGRGAMAVGGGALALGGAGAAGAAAMRGGKEKKAYLEAAATELARQTLLGHGINPDTGDKLAADDEVEALATEMLRAKGWL